MKTSIFSARLGDTLLLLPSAYFALRGVGNSSSSEPGAGQS